MSFLTDYGFTLPGSNQPTQTDPVAMTPSFLERYGFNLPKDRPQSAAPVPVPGMEEYQEGTKAKPETFTDILERIHSAVEPYSPPQLAKRALGSWGQSIGQEVPAGGQQIGEGIGNILSNQPASGIASVVGGLGRQVSALTGISAASDAIESAVTNLTGNPEAGKRASFLASTLLGSKGAKLETSKAPKLTPGYNPALTIREIVPPANAAVNKLVEDIGPQNVPSALQRVENSGGRLALMDTSDPVRTNVQGLVDPAQPEAMRAIVSNVRDRMATQPSAINSAYTAAFGENPKVGETLEKLKGRAQDVGKQMIQPAIDKAEPVDITNVISGLDNTIGKIPLKSLMAGKTPALPMTDAQSKAWELRQRLRGSLPDHDPNGPLTPNLFLDPEQAHEIQSQMRYEGSTLSKSATGSDRLLGGQTMAVRNQLVNAIDDAANGNYKPALAKYRDAKNVQESFNEGFEGNVLKNRQGVLEDRPEEFQKWFDSASPEEIMARQLGTRAEIDRQLNGVRNPVVGGTNITKIPYNKQKLTTLFGENEAGRLITAMENATLEGQTNARVLGNSKTAETLLANRAMSVPPVEALSQNVRAIGTPTAVLGGLGVGGEALGTLLHAPFHGGIPALIAAGTGTTLGLGRMGQQALAAQHTLRRNEAYARYASATSGPDLNEVIQALRSHPKVVGEMNKPQYSPVTP